MNRQRTIVNELEENLNEKKKKFKYEIMLVDERKKLEVIGNLDPENVDIEIMEEVGIQFPKTVIDPDAIDKIKELANKSYKESMKTSKSLTGNETFTTKHSKSIIQADMDENERDLER